MREVSKMAEVLFKDENLKNYMEMHRNILCIQKAKQERLYKNRLQSNKINNNSFKI